MENNGRLTMTIPEVAKALGISKALAYELARRDELPVKVLRIGQKRLLVSRIAFERVMNDTSKPAQKIPNNSHFTI
jgi:predicted DNA-binding transcriptional regulator AlpA